MVSSDTASMNNKKAAQNQFPIFLDNNFNYVQTSRLLQSKPTLSSKFKSFLHSFIPLTNITSCFEEEGKKAQRYHTHQKALEI
jgi:hypothetical protein